MVTRLPDKATILAACRGFPFDGTHPMLIAAVELARVHETRENAPACEIHDLDWQRMRLIQRIDLFVSVAAPAPSPTARLHTHTMGQVIDQIAQLVVSAYIALAAAPETLYVDSSARLAESGEAYGDLVEELSLGIRQLPGTISML
ncbi:hypothetical protein [Nocardia callitridis]|uniref:DUF4254 domain-containing protein n=1 Tax=Nocardia callitridis TaxID=648753 RepID=A0ABP9KGH2_9NOCA